MLRIGIIGVGAFGNKIAQLAEIHGFPVWYVNTSEEDTKGIFDSKNYHGTIIGNEGGCGQERSVAIELIKEHYKQVIQEFPDELLESDIVYVIGSAGGGTGSGFVPIMVDVLRSAIKGIQFGVVTTLPGKNEGIRAKKNSVDFMESVKNLDVPYLVYDNSKVDGSMVAIYDKINALIIDDLRILRGDFIGATSISVLDKKELYKLASTPGLIQIAKIENISARDFDHSSSSAMLITAFKSTNMVDFERNGKIHSFGIISSLEPNVLQVADSDYGDLFNYIGIPIETFHHTQHATSTGIYMIAIAVGMGYPSTRINDFVLEIKAVKDRLDAAASSKDVSLAGQLDWVEGSRTRKASPSKKGEVDMTVFKNY